MLPGDLVWIATGALVERLGTNEKSWTSVIKQGLIIAVNASPIVMESDGEICEVVVVFSGDGLFSVPASSVMHSDAVLNPGRLFPFQRLQE